jgi:hypothetical protein
MFKLFEEFSLFWTDWFWSEIVKIVTWPEALVQGTCHTDGVPVLRQDRYVSCSGIFDETGSSVDPVKIRIRACKFIGDPIADVEGPTVTDQIIYSL